MTAITTSAGERLPSEILDRLPPQSLEAERATIGSIIVDPQLCDDVAAIVTPEDFYADSNQKIYKHLLAMRDEGKRIDVLLLTERLKATGEWKAVGGAAYLGEVVSSAPCIGNVGEYAEIVAEKAGMRRLIHLETDGLRKAWSGQYKYEELAASQAAKLDGIASRRTAEVVSANQNMLDVMDVIDRAERGELIGFPTGLADVDRSLGGLFSQELTILAARPRMGKTAMASQIMHNAACVHRRQVLMISLEMSHKELGQRLLCARARVDGNRIRRSVPYTPGEKAAIAEASSELSMATYHIIDRPSMTVAEIGIAARQHQRGAGLDLLIVDYLQRVQPADPREPRHQQVGQVATGLKRIARELRIPVLCLAQLNREAEKGDLRPKLSQLRESGDIEADADMILFLHRPEVYAPKDPDLQGKAELIVGKNRNGPTPEFELRWEPTSATFLTPATKWQEESAEQGF